MDAASDNQIVTWIVAIVAAILGGALSAYGAWFAIGRQFKLQNQQADTLARTFFAFLLDEQIRSVRAMIEFRSSNAGEIAYFDLEKIQGNYSLFERNKEWLVRIADAGVRQNLVDVVSGLQLWTIALRGAANAMADAKSKLPLANPGSPNHNEYMKEIENAKGQVDGLFSNLSISRQHLETIRASLN